ncbi:iron(III) transport system ATP-binding protein/spermidine/putrescine transport system ATP-binding protein [Ancylobacter aquaticus]|uniref:Iron(III) transport system ATP-binding protein/spermidine/putrescine transport system ATP-binding protein n=1 Tax=Ancylobacter aquaticus TaxID=100 RepID=A0A4V2PJM9_ANCAQ|nr:ABC transporter ATP-binding protein [Ancylobacter aquaticus]TCK29176.1 iron(III) transport system ATP-binding protein/spermidine/putrescine transport system ATP-binding protein [Ancylobacter aquaticus]
MATPTTAVADSDVLVEVTDLVIRYGSYTAVHGVSFQIRRGEFLTLLGPSGCGKTTILRSIAGLERPSSGEIRIDGNIVYSSKLGIEVPAEKRNLSMVFQSYAIWPHLTAFENAVYGLRVRKRPKEEIKRQGDWALDVVRMKQFGERRASALSGGQQQRIALARAVAFSPKVILFDEPLSNLDANLRVQMRHEIKDLQRKLGVTSIYVTHDQEEALTMSDRIIVMSSGQIQQVSAPEHLYNFPANSFVANFIGSANLVEGRVDDATRAGDRVDFVTASGTRVHATDSRPPGYDGEALLALRTVYPQLAAGAQTVSPNSWACRITQATFSGDFIEYTVAAPWGPVVVRRPPSERFALEDPVVLSVAPANCVIIAR